MYARYTKCVSRRAAQSQQLSGDRVQGDRTLRHTQPSEVELRRHSSAPRKQLDVMEEI